MARKHHHKHRSSKGMEKLFIALAILTVVLVIAMVVITKVAPASSGYVITEDGHVHDAAGNHIGDYEDLFGSSYVLTEDGHIHDAEGNHIADAADLTGETATEEVPAAE